MRAAMKGSRLAVVAAFIVVGCGVTTSPSVGTTPDAGRDTGSPPLDVPPSLDTGALPDDTGALPVDTGAPPSDAPAAPDAGPPAEPLRAPDERWTWVDVAGMRCGNGTGTGVGLNLTAGSSDVLIFLQGGGACWDGAGCYGVVPTSFNVRTGYDRVQFATDVQRILLPLQRNNPANPFRRLNMVYVPYCTGDVHAGDRVATYRYLGAEHVMHHVGARNMDALLRRLAATFPRARRVWLVGDSAGGFGAALNMDRVQRALPHTRVDVLDDSGPPVSPPADRWRAWVGAWNLQFPSGCARCGEGIGPNLEFLRTRYPDNRFGLISYTHDAVISTFMGISAFAFNDALRAAAAAFARDWPNGHYYLLPGALHVGLLTPTPGLLRWMDQMVSDDPRWRSEP